MPNQIYATHYEIQEDIAQGAMGMVRKALDLKLNRIVALKIVHPHLCSDETFRKRFLREARAMAQLQHANIVTIYAVEQHEGSQFIVMEYFPGGNLSARISPDTCLPLEEAVAITQQLASALAYAHDRGIIHRDVKPANVLINSHNLIKLTDFGIAAALDESPLTNAGQLIGTLRYMSPEQARDATLDGRSDLYSLGLMFYEMVTGSHPRRNLSNAAILSMLAAEGNAPPLAFPADVPPDVRAIIQELLKFKPTDRIKDARALMRRLEALNLGPMPSPLGEANQPSADATMFDLDAEGKLIPLLKQEQGDARQPDYTRMGITALLGVIFLVSAFGLYKIAPKIQDLFEKPSPPVAPAKLVMQSVPSVQKTEVSPTPPTAGNAGDGQLPVPNVQRKDLANISAPPLAPPKEPLVRRPAVETPAPLPSKGKQELLERPSAPVAPAKPVVQSVPLVQKTEASPTPPNAGYAGDTKLAVAKVQETDLAKTRALPVVPPKQSLAIPPAVEPSAALPSKGKQDTPPPIPSVVVEKPSVPSIPPMATPVETGPAVPPSNQEILQRLERVRTLVEKRDLPALAALTTMSKDQNENIQALFDNYTTITASLGKITTTATTLTTALRIDKLITVDGESVPVEDMLRSIPITVPRNGDQWGPITW